MKQKFRKLLHAYRVEAFKVGHANDDADSDTAGILASTGEALNNAYEYHFREDPDPERIETFNMIKNYTLESIMPPVLEKVMRRVIVLEKQHESIVQLIDNLLEALSKDESIGTTDQAV